MNLVDSHCRMLAPYCNRKKVIDIAVGFVVASRDWRLLVVHSRKVVVSRRNHYGMFVAEVLVESVVCRNDMLKGRESEVHKNPLCLECDDAMCIAGSLSPILGYCLGSAADFP